MSTSPLIRNEINGWLLVEVIEDGRPNTFIATKGDRTKKIAGWYQALCWCYFND